MVVVLTNLSFIICQLLIDFSNIAGDQIYKLLEGINIGNTSGTYDFGNFVQSIIGTLFTGVVGGAGVFVAAVTWDKWLIPLLLFFLVTVIGVLFFGILLAVRKAAVIILAIFSPIAIICYALPNTKRVYDRWFKLFSSMLLLYPICGALMGGGIFASKLLLSVSSATSTGFFFQLVAMLVQIVPFFFVPTLVRSSFAAMGNLGNRIASFGDRLGRTASGAIRGAEATKDLQRRMNATEAARRARRYATNRDVRGRLANGLSRLGMDGASDRLLKSNGRTRAQSRAINQANSEFIETERSRANILRGLTEDDEKRAENLRNNLRLQQEEEEIRTYSDRYKVTGMSTNDKVMEQEYENALTRLMSNSDDTDAMAQLMAAQRILAKTDPGRKALQNQLYRASSRIGEGNHNVGHEKAANRLLSESGGDIKARNRGFFTYLTDAANGGAVRGTFTESTNAGDLSMRSSAYDFIGTGKYSPDALVGADETALIRLNEQIANGAIQGSDLADLGNSAIQALSNPNITDLNSAVGRELESMANNYYLSTPLTRNATNAAGVDISDARRMAATTSMDLDRIIRNISNGRYDQTMANKMANVAERALLESKQNRLTVASGNRDRLRDIMVAAGRSTAAVDQNSNDSSRIVIPRGPGFPDSTRDSDSMRR